VSVVTTPAVLLRSFNYSETSRILRFYTRDHGVVGVMAKGTRSRSARGGTGLETFASGSLTIHFRAGRDLQTLRDFAPARDRRGLATDVLRFAGASVVAELVLEHGVQEAGPEIFDRLEAALDALAEVPRPALPCRLLQEAWGLVALLGYRPEVERCVQCGADPGADLARFDFGAGGIRCGHCAAGATGPRLGPVARQQIRGFTARIAPGHLERPRAHLRLLSDFVTYHVSGGKPLQSFRFLGSMLRGTAEASDEQGEDAAATAEEPTDEPGGRP